LVSAIAIISYMQYWYNRQKAISVRLQLRLLFPYSYCVLAHVVKSRFDDWLLFI